ncbi:MAG: DUF3987 domain-containing protein [Clostridiales bacterium]|nr:DUF3987 domain-containing protein [Clostridiales bacterium]
MSNDDRMLSEVLSNISMEEYKRLRDSGATLEEIHDSVSRIQERGESFEPDPPGGPWSPPVPFYTVELPPFPVDKLPPPLSSFVAAVAECYQVDPAMPGVLALGVLAGVFQGKFRMFVKPGFTTELSLYTVAVAAPGERKTPVFQRLTAPMNDYEAARLKDEGPDIQRNQQERRLLEGRIKAVEGQLMKGKGADRSNLEAELEGLNQQLDDFDDEVEFRVLADDTTPEKLVDLLDKHGSMLVASDEPGLFTSLKGRYDSNSSIDPYLKGVDGSSIRVDRIGRPSNIIPAPHLSLALGAQPAAIKDFVNNPTFSGRGLVQRFLYANCKSSAGNRRWSVENIPDDILLDYEGMIYRALQLEAEKPVMLYFTDEAQREAGRFGDEAERELLDGGRLDFDKSWGNKFPGYVFRIAALFHLCAALSDGKDPNSRVEVEWLQAAEAVGWCLAKHTESIFTEAGADPDVGDAKYISQKLQRLGEPEVSKRELRRICRRFKRADEMAPALKMLEEREYIRIDRSLTGGRPTEIIRVNPFWLT